MIGKRDCLFSHNDFRGKLIGFVVGVSYKLCKRLMKRSFNGAHLNVGKSVLTDNFKYGMQCRLCGLVW